MELVFREEKLKGIKLWLAGSLAILILGTTYSVPAGAFNSSRPEIPAQNPDRAVLSPEIKALLQQNNLQPAQYRTPAPDFTLYDLDGRKVSLSQFRDETVLLGFFTTW